MRGKPLVLALSVALGGGSCVRMEIFPPPNPINGVSVYLPLGQVIQVNDPTRIHASGFYNGNGLGTEDPHTVSFVASDTTVLRLQPTTWIHASAPTTLATGLKPGLITLTATLNGVSASDTLRVIPEVASITLLPTSTSFFVGDTIPVAVEVRAMNGQLIGERTPLVLSETPGVVTLSSSYGNNRVVGANPGTTVLTAFIGPDTGRVAVTVKARTP